MKRLLPKIITIIREKAETAGDNGIDLSTKDADSILNVLQPLITKYMKDAGDNKADQIVAQAVLADQAKKLEDSDALPKMLDGVHTPGWLYTAVIDIMLLGASVTAAGAGGFTGKGISLSWPESLKIHREKTKQDTVLSK